MSLFHTLRQAFAATKRRSGGVSAQNGQRFWPDWPNTSSVAGTRAESLAAVIRCVGLYADAVADLPLRCVRRDPDGGAAEFVDMPLLRTWSFTDKELLVASALLSGNGYALFSNARMRSYPASRVVIERDVQTGEPFYRFTTYEQAAQQPLLAADKVVHVRYRCFADPREGQSPLALARSSVDAALETQEATRELMGNLSSAGIVLSTDKKISPDTAALFKSQWEEKFGRGSRGRTAILGDGLTAARMESWKASDAQLIEFARYSVAEVARIFGVPLQLLGETASLNYSTAVELSRTFTLNALGPFLRRVGAELSAKLLTERQRGLGQWIEFDTEGLTLSPGKESSDYYGSLVSGGILTPNEARNALGWEDVEGGDKLREPKPKADTKSEGTLA